MELANSRTRSLGKGDSLNSVLFKEVHTCVGFICVWDFPEIPFHVDFLTSNKGCASLQLVLGDD